MRELNFMGELNKNVKYSAQLYSKSPTNLSRHYYYSLASVIYEGVMVGDETGGNQGSDHNRL